MQRRSFLTALASVGLTPNLPFSGMAKAAVAPSVAALDHLKAAQIIVRAHNRCSVPMLQRLLKLDAGMAQDVQGILIERGVITAPGTAGLSTAINPSNLDVFLPGSSARAGIEKHVKAAVEKKVKSYFTEANPVKPADLSFDEGTEPEASEDERQNGVPGRHAQSEE